MLATTHTVSLLVHTLQDQLIAPWGYWQTGATVIAFAMLGLVHLLWRDRFALTTLVACFGPYIVFDLLFQEAITTRYALPLIMPIAYLVICGASLLHRHLAVVVDRYRCSVGVCRRCNRVYTRRCPRRHFACSATCMLPRFNLRVGTGCARWRSGVGDAPKPDFSMRRPIQRVGEAMPKLAAHLPAPPKHEWPRGRKYWNAVVVIPCGSSATCCEATRTHSQPTPPDALSMALPFHDARRRRQARRTGLARVRRARLVSRRRLGAHA